MRYLWTAVVLLFTASISFAGDIVTVPTANQLQSGQFDVANYYLGLDMPDAAPQYVQAQTIYIGVTDRLEVDAHRYNIDKADDSTIINANVLLLKENALTPDLVLGTRNLFEEQVTDPQSKKRSWYLSAAKTLNPPINGVPKLPIVRAHLSLGTEDFTLLNEKRHDGLFGGLQVLLKPEIGAVALHDGNDLITGLTYTPKNKGFTGKGGTFGNHWWVGLSYAHSLN